MTRIQIQQKKLKTENNLKKINLNYKTICRKIIIKDFPGTWYRYLILFCLDLDPFRFYLDPVPYQSLGLDLDPYRYL